MHNLLQLKPDNQPQRFPPAAACGFDILHSYQESIMKKLLAFIAAAGFSLSAFAAPEVYVIDGSHTFPRFEYTHMGFSTQQSRSITPPARSRWTAPPRRAPSKC